VRYKCKNDLVDVACPIVVDGARVGAVFIGQFYDEPPDLAPFREQAQVFGFDEETCLVAVNRVPVLAADVVEARIGLLRGLTAFLGEMGLDRLQAAGSLARRGTARGARRVLGLGHRNRQVHLDARVLRAVRAACGRGGILRDVAIRPASRGSGRRALDKLDRRC
jgi:hypothetical protein